MYTGGPKNTVCHSDNNNIGLIILCVTLQHSVQLRFSSASVFAVTVSIALGLFLHLQYSQYALDVVSHRQFCVAVLVAQRQAMVRRYICFWICAGSGKRGSKTSVDKNIVYLVLSLCYLDCLLEISTCRNDEVVNRTK